MSTATIKEIECTLCGKKLNAEELENPHMDTDDTPICDECHHEHFEFTCCDCCNYGDVEDQHNMLVVFEICGGGYRQEVFPGIYRIKAGPYYSAPMIGEGSLFPDKLERIADLNPDMDGNGYPCGHLCIDCQKHLLAQFSAKCAGCNLEQSSCLKVRIWKWDKKCKKQIFGKVGNYCAGCRYRAQHWDAAK